MQLNMCITRLGRLTFDPADKAIPTDSLRFIPPDSVLDWACAFSSSLRSPLIVLALCIDFFLDKPLSYSQRRMYTNQT